ncbi:MAG TPA: hypothetical protein VF746_20125 [Longimicrobium sp.]
MASDIGRIPLFPGVDRLLRRLADRGVALAIVTSNSYANVRRVLGLENAALVRDYGCGAGLFGQAGQAQEGAARQRRPSRRGDLHRRRAPRPARRARGEPRLRGGVAGYTTLESLRAHAPEEVFASMDEIVEKLARGEAPPLPAPSA